MSSDDETQALSKVEKLVKEGHSLISIIEKCTKKEVCLYLAKNKLDFPASRIKDGGEVNNAAPPTTADPNNGVKSIIRVSERKYEDAEVNAIAAVVDSLVTVSPGKVKVNTSKLSNRYTRYPVPNLVIQYVESLGHNLYSLFNEYINGNGEVFGREDSVPYDYAFLVNVFTVWVVATERTYRDTVTGYHGVVEDLLLDAAKDVGLLLNGDNRASVSGKSLTMILKAALHAYNKRRNPAGASRPKFPRTESSGYSPGNNYNNNNNDKDWKTPQRQLASDSSSPVRQNITPHIKTATAQVPGKPGYSGCFLCDSLDHNKKDCPKNPKNQK